MKGNGRKDVNKMTIVKNIFKVIFVIAAILIVLWIAGFHLETYDYVVGKVTALWYHNDVIWYWNW